MYVKLFITFGIGQLRFNPSNRGYLSKGISYIESLEYVILTKIKLIKNEFQGQMLILYILSKVFSTLKNAFSYVYSLI